MVKYIEVIADNGGGLTLQVGKTWRHNYDSPKQVAVDLRALLQGEHPLRDWEGNEAAEWPIIEYSYDVVRNGGYRWYTGTPHQVVKAIMADIECSWRNVQDLARHLGIEKEG